MKKLALTTFLTSFFAISAHADLINQQPTTSNTAVYANMPISQLTTEANAGKAAAQFYLGNKFKAANDLTQAFKWYKKAADQGIPSAQLNVGQMYAKGLGTKQDLNQAKNYLMKAAKLGDNRASYNLAVLEEKANNYASAYQWYELSTRDGMLDHRAKTLSEQKIIKLAANLSQNDMRLARERSDRWIQAD